MSDQGQQQSDAEKMRNKRLARLGASSTPTTRQPVELSEPVPPVTESSTPREPPSAGSRLLNFKREQSQTNDQAGPSSISTPMSGKSDTLSSPGAVFGKRPSTAAATTRTAQPQPIPVKTAAAVATLNIPYRDWESQRVQDIFSVTLSVGAHWSDRQNLLTVSARRCREE